MWSYHCGQNNPPGKVNVWICRMSVKLCIVKGNVCDSCLWQALTRLDERSSRDLLIPPFLLSICLILHYHTFPLGLHVLWLWLITQTCSLSFDEFANSCTGKRILNYRNDNQQIIWICFIISLMFNLRFLHIKLLQAFYSWVVF